jgi:signal transduction histidine kinase
MSELTPQGVVDIGILDGDGKARFFAVDRDKENFDFSWRSYFKKAHEIPSIDTGSEVIELQNLERDNLGFMIAIPFYETSGVQNEGVILGSLSLETLINRHIAPFKPPGDGHIYLVNSDLDIIWSSDSEAVRSSLLSEQQAAFTEMTDEMNLWTSENAVGNAYIYSGSLGGNDDDLIAYAPVHIGQKIMAVCVKTPGNVARLTSLTVTQSQQYVFILSILTILAGVLIGGLILRRETKRRFQAENALKKSEMEQAILSERNRLASDLHDSVTQALYGIVLHADAAKGQISAGETNKADEYLTEIKDAGKEGLAEMRLLIFELRPPLLVDEGLSAALEARLNAVEKRAGLSVSYKSEIESRLPLAVEEGLYWVALEALNNALKHAKTKQIKVSLKQHNELIILEVMDDGCGFDRHKAETSGGMGLKNMITRTKKLDGRIQINSTPGNGTQIKVEVGV